MSGSPVSLSLQVALASTAVTFFLGILAAYGVRKLRRGSGFFDAVFTLPLVLPPTVVGFLLLVLLGNYGPFQGIYERFQFHIVFTWWANIIAAIVVSFPLMYRTAYGTFLQVNEEYLQVARTLGMSEKKDFLEDPPSPFPSGTDFRSHLDFYPFLGGIRGDHDDFREYPRQDPDHLHSHLFCRTGRTERAGLCLGGCRDGIESGIHPQFACTDTKR